MSDAFALEDLDPAFHVQFTDAVQAVTDALAASGAIRDRVRKARIVVALDFERDDEDLDNGGVSR